MLSKHYFNFDLQKILNLPPLVSQSMVVLHFFDAWGTDIRALNQHSTDVVGAHGLGR